MQKETRCFVELKTGLSIETPYLRTLAQEAFSIAKNEAVKTLYSTNARLKRQINNLPCKDELIREAGVNANRSLSEQLYRQSRELIPDEIGNAPAANTLPLYRHNTSKSDINNAFRWNQLKNEREESKCAAGGSRTRTGKEREIRRKWESGETSREQT